VTEISVAMQKIINELTEVNGDLSEANGELQAALQNATYEIELLRDMLLEFTKTHNSKDEIIQDILTELARAEHLHPVFPAIGRQGDHVYAASILSEERGEVVKSANSWQMEGRGSVLHIRSELVHCCAMSLRYLLNLEKVERQRINEGARQELHEEHNVDIGIGVGINLNDSEWWDKEPVYQTFQISGGPAPKASLVDTSKSSTHYAQKDEGVRVEAGNG